MFAPLHALWLIVRSRHSTGKQIQKCQCYYRVKIDLKYPLSMNVWFITSKTYHIFYFNPTTPTPTTPTSTTFTTRTTTTSTTTTTITIITTAVAHPTSPLPTASEAYR
jgi:hypothetical protein